MNSEVLLHRRSAVATITLNRPASLNAITSDMKNTLLTILADLSLDESLRCLVLTGAGRAFCAGADRGELGKRAEQSAPTILRQIEATQMIAEQLSRLTATTVAKVNGVVAGGGLGLALACDVTIANDDADVVFGFLNNNLIPDAGLAISLCSALGSRFARHLMFTRERLTAVEATEMRIFGELSARDSLDARVNEVVSGIVKSDPLAMKVTKQIYSEHHNQRLTAEALGQVLMIAYNRKGPR